ncbi:IS701 family transposase [Streptomyces humidus]
MWRAGCLESGHVRFGRRAGETHRRQRRQGAPARPHTMAEFAGEKEPKALQRFLNLTSWSAALMRDLVRDYAMECFADPRGVLIADPTGFEKKGVKSAGVQRQYSGTLGRIDNCQIGTFLAYVNRRGDRVLIDRELYLPKDSWAVDFERRREAGIPDEVVFQTRPQQVQAMIDRAVAAGVPFSWFVACYNPRGESLPELVAVIGLRWPVEECFEAAKQQAGLDNYQVRKYDAWHRHITMAMLALAFLAAMARTPQKGALRTWAVTAGRERDGSRP